MLPLMSLSSTQDDGLGELEVLDLLARRRVKGRGAIGSRADEPGPFLPPGADGEMVMFWHASVSAAALLEPCAP